MSCVRCSRTLTIAVVALISLCCAIANADDAAAVSGPPFVSINGEAFSPAESAPIMTAGTIMLPVKDLFAGIGGKVSANAAGTAFTVDRAGLRLEMALDKYEFSIGGKQVQFYIPPTSVGKSA